MADINIKFNLKQPKANKPTPIRVSISWQGNRLITNTGETVHPKYWNMSQQVRTSKDFPQYSQINKRLNEIKAEVSKLYHKLKEVGEDVGKPELKEAIAIYLDRADKNDVPRDFLSFVDYYIKKKQGTINPQTNRLYSERTFSKYRRVKKLCIEINPYINFKNFDQSFYHKHYEKLMIKKNMSLATIGKYTESLKTILLAAMDSEHNVNRFTHFRKYPVLTSESTKIYLDDNEIDAIYKLDLSHKPSLEKVRDMFVIGCQTGFRFSDLYSIGSHNIEDDFITLKTYKTGAVVIVGILEETRSILEKYNYNLPKSISNQKFNEFIKEVGRLAGINNMVRTSITRANGEEVELKSKYKLISTHTARRSFCTNLYNKGIDTISIIAQTGHASEAMLLKYLKVDKKEHARRTLTKIKELRQTTKSMYANG